MAWLSKHWWLRLARRLLGLVEPNDSTRYWRLYALELADDCYYVGITSRQSVLTRYEEHSSGKGAMWTKSHPPRRIRYVKALGWMNEGEAIEIETKTTVEFIRSYGVASVRGGRLVRSDPLKHATMYTAYVAKLKITGKVWW